MKRHPTGYEVDEASGCWNWILKLDRKGYGVKNDGGTYRGAHRVVYEKYVGPVPEGFQLDHLCRNPRCVNPAHLEPVTAKENSRRGSATKLTPDAVREIRAPSRGRGLASTLARRYGVSQATIYRIRGGQAWGDV